MRPSPPSCPVEFQPHRRILVVDHDPYARHLSADMLIQHGYEVNAVEDGVAGWEELRINNYHLLITEHDLPKISGVKLVRRVRAARLPLPVVMVSFRFPLHLAERPSLQLAATLLKPVSETNLLNTVREVLDATECPPNQIMPLSNWHPRQTESQRFHQGVFSAR